jgi:hypothetical protein
MYSFGSGVLYGVPTAANSTPARFGGLQEVSLDFTFNIKELHGQYQFPLAIARGTGKISCKAKQANINSLMFNQIFFGQTLAVGETAVVVEEAGTIPSPSGPYTVTVSNSATFLADLGVTFTLTGLPLTKVASNPTTGQYSVSAGVYTFAAADAGLGVKLNYTYTVAATGKKLVINNQILGTTPFFQASFTSIYNSKACHFVLNQCTSNKLTFATKLEDFVIPEFDFSCFADASGVIGTLSFDE